MIRRERYLYEIPLIHTATPRRGLLLHLSDREGKSTWTEISPLPGWSRETLSDAIEQCDAAWPQLATACDPLKVLEELSLYPSVAFGLEAGFKSLSAPLALSPLPLSALLMGSPAEILIQADNMRKKGVKTAKLKIGSLPIEEAMALIKELQSVFRLRIDINRRWTLKQALSFFATFPKQAFDYIEEPVFDVSDLKTFSHPFALDESLREKNSEEIFSFPHLKTLIVKPTLTGNSSRWLPLKKWKKDIVLSSAFESGIGIAHIASCALNFFPGEISMGLDTYSYLLEDTLDSKLHIADGKLQFPTALVPALSKLKKI